jgi:hypothetical protein
LGGHRPTRPLRHPGFRRICVRRASPHGSSIKKIPTIFERDWNGDRSRVTREPNPACRWVFDGEGVATRKHDGACWMVRDGKLYKRRELGPKQSAPAVRLDVVAVIPGWEL